MRSHGGFKHSSISDRLHEQFKPEEYIERVYELLQAAAFTRIQADQGYNIGINRGRNDSADQYPFRVLE
jgi:hypothetical protein